MTIIDGGIRPQCKLTLRHISRVAKAMNAQGQLRDVVQVIKIVVQIIEFYSKHYSTFPGNLFCHSSKLHNRMQKTMGTTDNKCNY